MKNTTLILMMLTVLVFLACSKTIVRRSYPKKFEGLVQLVLASETTNLNFTETKKSRFLFITIGTAEIRVDANAPSTKKMIP